MNTNLKDGKTSRDCQLYHSLSSDLMAAYTKFSSIVYTKNTGEFRKHLKILISRHAFKELMADLNHLGFMQFLDNPDLCKEKPKMNFNGCELITSDIESDYILTLNFSVLNSA